MRHVLDGVVERRLVGLGRPGKAGQLADELERAGADFVVRRRRFEIVQRSDVPAHGDSSQKSRGMKKAGPPLSRKRVPWPEHSMSEVTRTINA